MYGVNPRSEINQSIKDPHRATHGQGEEGRAGAEGGRSELKQSITDPHRATHGHGEEGKAGAEGRRSELLDPYTTRVSYAFNLESPSAMAAWGMTV